MAVGSVSPVGIQQFHDANGNPLAGGKLYFYLAGTTTPTPAYADVGLTIPLANPVVLDAGGWAPELFLGALSYKEVLQTPGGVNLWTADNIITPTALRSTQGVISLTGTQHNVPIPAGIITFLLCQNGTPLTITGFAGGTPGQLLIIRTYGSAPVHFANWNSSGSAAGNTLVNFVSSGPTSISVSGIAIYVYANLPHAAGQLHWMLIAHEQGQSLPIDPATYNFTAFDTGSWTVAPADVQQLSYFLRGTTLLLSFAIQATTIAGAPTQLVMYCMPYQLREGNWVLPVLTTGIEAAPGYSNAVAKTWQGTNALLLERASAAAWPTVTDTGGVYGQLMVDAI